MTHRFSFFALPLVAVLAGCPANPWTTGNVSGPLIANEELVWLNRTIAVAAIVDPTGAHEPFGVSVTTLPRAIAPTLHGFIVTGGRGDAPVVDVFTLPAGTVKSLSVQGAYDFAQVSPDNHYAVLYYDPTATPAPGGPAARDNNQVCVVDLDALTTKTVSLQTQSIAPSSVLFSPDGQTAAVMMNQTVVFFLLADPTVQVQVPLALSDGTMLTPQKALFAPDGAYLYVQTSGSSDVLALNVTLQNGAINTAVNFLSYPGATGLVDIAVPKGTGFNRYIAALYSDQAVLLDATGDTSLTQFVELTNQASNFVDLGGGQLLIVNSSGTQLAAWEPLLNLSEQNTLDAAPSGLPMIAQGHAVFVNPSISIDNGTTAALTSVSEEDTGASIEVHQAPIVLGGAPVAWTVAAPSGTVFVGVPIPRTNSGAGPQNPNDKKASQSSTTGAIVSLNPTTLAIGGVVLDNNIESIGILGDIGFAVHQDSLGNVSFFSATNPSRQGLRREFEFLSDLKMK